MCVAAVQDKPLSKLTVADIQRAAEIQGKTEDELRGLDKGGSWGAVLRKSHAARMIASGEI